MNKIIRLIILAAWVLLSAADCLAGAATDSTRLDTARAKQVEGEVTTLVPVHWNVIKFNPTPMLLWSSVRNFTISYERMVNKSQSVAIQIGYLEFPSLFSDTIAGIVSITSRQKWGVNLSAEYRFYLGKRNRRPAPDGVYLAPYFSYYGFRFKNGLDLLHTNIDQEGGLSGALNVFNAGVSLGYQFIFWKRVSLDLVLFGPSFSMYSGSVKFAGTLDESQMDKIDKEIVDALFNRFPLLRTLFSGETLQRSGTMIKLSPGFRYSVSVGFHF